MGQLKMQGIGSKRPFPKRKNLGQNPGSHHCDARKRNGGGKLGPALHQLIYVAALFKERGPTEEYDRCALE
jgi:hypothetical protein